MARVLAIDTAGPVIGVALSAGDHVLQRVGREPRAEGHLLPWALGLCAEAGIALADLEGVVVAAGPGAFTGVRVGLATALGLGVSLGVPVWGEVSLRSRALRAGDAGVLAMLDARKGRVYAGLLRGGVWLEPPADVAPEIAAGWGAREVAVATGEGALVYREVLSRHGVPVHREASDPAVDALVRLGVEALAQRRPGDPNDLAPIYLRDADALPSARRGP